MIRRKMASKKVRKPPSPNFQSSLESLMGNVEVCRSVGLEIINNTEKVTLEDFRSYCFSGKIRTVLPFEIGPHSIGRCIFAKTPYSLRGSVGVLVCKASSFSLAIMFSNPFDYNLYSIEFALELFKTENHMGSLRAVFSRMMESKPYCSSTLFQRAKQEGRRGSRHAAQVPLRPVERPLVEQAVPLHPWFPHGSDLHAAAPPWVEEPPVEQVDVAWRRLQPMERPCRSRPQAGAAARGEEPTQEQGCWGVLLPVGDPC
ncbi:Toxin PsTX-20A-like protein [Aix galericulata]|nr:Toxin PsTX-20A-like protein [Aix galericulata]